MKYLHRAIAGVLAATAVAAGSAIAQPRYEPPPRYSDAPPPRYVQGNPANFGVIEAIDAESNGGNSSGNKAAGTILGGVIGGVIGHQFGSGRGNDAATVAGALGGAVAGHEIAENRSGRAGGYRVRVRLDTGDTRTFWQDNTNGLVVGDRVQIDNDRLFRYSGGAERYDNRPQYEGDRPYRSAEPAVGYTAPPPPDQREYHYDAQGYRVDQFGNRYDQDGYWVDERGIRQEYQDPPLPADTRAPR